MTKAITTKVDEKTLAQLHDAFPVEPKANKIFLPRLGLVTQDKTEGKGKSMKVVAEAGTFFIEKQTEEVNEEGKNIWDREELGESIKGIILFQRKQLRFYDEGTEQYTSSPIYDTDEEVIPLWCDKAEVDRGTPAELKSRKKYQGLTAKGKPTSKLEENRILYVLIGEDAYQMNLRGTSMYSFLGYARKVLPPAMLTTFGSEAKEKGSIAWNQMTFEGTPLGKKEVMNVLERIQEIKEVIGLEKAQYAPTASSDDSDLEDDAVKKF